MISLAALLSARASSRIPCLDCRLPDDALRAEFGSIRCNDSRSVAVLAALHESQSIAVDKAHLDAVPHIAAVDVIQKGTYVLRTRDDARLARRVITVDDCQNRVIGIEGLEAFASRSSTARRRPSIAGRG